MIAPDTFAIINASNQLHSLLLTIFEHKRIRDAGEDVWQLTGLALDLSGKINGLLYEVEAAEEEAEREADSPPAAKKNTRKPKVDA